MATDDQTMWLEAQGSADGGGIVPVRFGGRAGDLGPTSSVSQSLLLDPLKWARWTPPVAVRRPPDHVVPTGAMIAKAAKWRPSLVPAGTMKRIAAAMQAGIDRGHVENDWQKRDPVAFYDAAIRHLDAIAQDPRALDESGVPHLHHALASLAILAALTERPA